MHNTFTREPLHIDDIVVYLKNERTGSSTIRKCKFIGCVTGFTNTKVNIRQLSDTDQFVTPNECKDYGIVSVNPSDVVHIIISKYQDNSFVLPRTIGDVTFYDEEDLIKWVETQQKINESKRIIGEFDGVPITKENINNLIAEFERNGLLNK